jgi:hypothetical protein
MMNGLIDMRMRPSCQSLLFIMLILSKQFVTTHYPSIDTPAARL